MQHKIQDIMRMAPVIPVITIDRIEQALPLCEALVSAGLMVLEVTLRTPVALEAIALLRKELPDAIVGAGTVINPALLQHSVDQGAQFLVSPGATPALLDAAAVCPIPLLPGVNSPSEVMILLERNITAMKFFPAQAAGGIEMLKSIGAPLPQALFCPTGGISLANAADYLALANVACIGGSWMVGKDLVESQNWKEIYKRALEAASLH